LQEDIAKMKNSLLEIGKDSCSDGQSSSARNENMAQSCLDKADK